MIRALAVASEAFPLVKTGGLADVVGALPAALRPQQVEVRTLLPGYPVVMRALTAAEPAFAYPDLFGGPARVLADRVGQLDVLVLDAPHLFDRPGNPYLGPDGKDWSDNWRRFAALARAGADIGRGKASAFVPDVVHAHDWQGGLTMAFLATAGPPVATVFTVHNLAFQGTFPVSIFSQLGLPARAFSIDGVEYFGGVGYLKTGLQYADAITTVSPTYAEEIATPENGMGLDGLLRARRAVVHGILNGIDTGAWNPKSDVHLPFAYSATTLPRRSGNRAAIAERFALADDETPLFCVVSRLTWQKGMDLLATAVDGLVKRGARLAVLGAGEAAIEQQLKVAAARHPGRVGIVIGYDEALAHLLQGGADAILVPSRFEPCGLTQFYGLRYGCVPVVARVGGLADTIIHANDAALGANVATGIQFAPDAHGLAAAIDHAVALHMDSPTWRRIQRNGMSANVSWDKSARRYADLYRSLLRTRGKMQ